MNEKNQSELNKNQEESGKEFETAPPVTGEESPASVLPEAPEISEGTFPETKEGEVKEPTAFQRFIRQAVTWLAVVAVAFLAGMITFYFTLYQPKIDQLNQTEANLSETEQELNALTAELQEVTAQRDALENAQDYRMLLSIMVDIYTARLALTQENTSAAKTALSDTEDTLTAILSVIREFDANLASTIPQRLSLIRTNIDGNIENAIADCDLMIKDLRDIEKALYQ